MISNRVVPRMAAMIAAVVLVALGSGTAYANPYTTGLVQNRYGKQLCLDARSDAPWSPSKPGDIVWLWSCNYFQQQQWFFGGGGNETGSPLLNAAGDMCLDVIGGSTATIGSGVQMWTCNGSANQLWDWSPDGGSTLCSEIYYNNQRLCLDARADSGNSPNNNGDALIVWPWSASAPAQELWS